jgi:hypothetical protein
LGGAIEAGNFEMAAAMDRGGWIAVAQFGDRMRWIYWTWRDG